VTTSSATTAHPVVGETAPDITIQRDDGAPLTMSRLWREGPAVLVFLRHLGCTFCREHVAQLVQDSALYQELNAVVALITISKPEDTAAFCRALPPQFICCSDTDKQAYHAYGLARAGAQELFAPHVLARGFQAALHGHFQGLPKGDPFQMPGVFVVDMSGIVRYVHRHRDAADNPPNSEIFAALSKCGLSTDYTD
jgi:peroxiredoxin